MPSKPLPSSEPCLFPGLGAEGRASELVLGGSISLVVRAAAPEPQGARLLSEHALHHQRGLVQATAPAGSRGSCQEGPRALGAAPARQWGALPGGEGNVKGDRGGGRVDRSCLQQPTAWGDLERHGVPIWLLLACRVGRTRRRLHTPPAALTPASWCLCSCPPPQGGIPWGKWPSELGRRA